MRFLHTCIRVKDLEASVKFYKEALGFIEAGRKDVPADEFTLVYMKLPNSDHELELTYNYGHEAYDLGNGYSHIALGIHADEFEKLHAKHKAAGYEVTEMYGIAGEPPSIYFITDPDGYDIEIIKEK